jgi:hypothetical protein
MKPTARSEAEVSEGRTPERAEQSQIRPMMTAHGLKPIPRENRASAGATDAYGSVLFGGP